MNMLSTSAHMHHVIAVLKQDFRKSWVNFRQGKITDAWTHSDF